MSSSFEIGPDHKSILLNLSPQDLSIARYVINDPNQTIGPELIAQANIFYDDIVAELVEKAIERLNQCETLIIRGSMVTK